MYGTLLIIASIAYIIFAIFFAERLKRTVRWVLTLGVLIVLLAIQLAYLSSSSVIIYGVFFNETTGAYQYSTMKNPIAEGVVASTIITFIVGGVMTAYYIFEESAEKLGKTSRRVYIEA
jgi:glucan phosphoethanolaminetransferase (alkaline phosphatase superfamily)